MNPSLPVPKIIGGALLVVALALAGFLAYDKGLLENVFPLGEQKISPEKSLAVLQKVFDTWGELKSSHQKHSILVNIEGSLLGARSRSDNPFIGSLAAALFAQAQPFTENTMAARLVFEFEGDSDRHDPNNPRGVMMAGLRAAVTERGVEKSYAAEGEMRIVDRAFYFVIRQLPEEVLLFVPPGVMNQWLSLPIPDPDEIRQKFGSESVTLDELWGEESTKKLQEQIRILKDAFAKHPFVYLVQSLERVKIGGEKVARYRIEIDPQQLKQFLLEASAHIPEASAARETIAQEFDNASRRIEKLGGELWIGENTSYIHKSIFEAAFPFENKNGQGGDGRAGVAITSEYSNFNVPVNVALPEGAAPVETLLGDMFGGGIGAGVFGAPQPPGDMSDLNADDDSDGLPNVTEEAFCTDPQRPDTDGDSYLDGAEVNNGYNPNGSGTLNEYFLSGQCAFQQPVRQ